MEFIGTRGDPVLIGSLWALDLGGTPYAGEPARALLFCSRAQARAWCAQTMAGWRDGRQRDDVVARWRVRAVRVRETVRSDAAATIGLPCTDCRTPNACTPDGACLEAYIGMRIEQEVAAARERAPIGALIRKWRADPERAAHLDAAQGHARAWIDSEGLRDTVETVGDLTTVIRGRGYARPGSIACQLQDTGNGFIARFPGHGSCDMDHCISLDYSQARELALALTPPAAALGFDAERTR